MLSGRRPSVRDPFLVLGYNPARRGPQSRSILEGARTQSPCGHIYIRVSSWLPRDNGGPMRDYNKDTEKEGVFRSSDLEVTNFEKNLLKGRPARTLLSLSPLLLEEENVNSTVTGRYLNLRRTSTTQTRVYRADVRNGNDDVSKDI